MPIVFIHGVAVRDEDDPQFGAVERLSRGAEWSLVEQMLREYVVPAVRTAAGEIHVSRVYWGDLATPPTQDLTDRSGTAEAAYDAAAHLDDLSPEVLGTVIEGRLMAALPPDYWPEVIEAVWSTVRDPALPAMLAARSTRSQRSWLAGLVRARLTRAAPDLDARLRTVGAEMVAAGRRGVRRAMDGVRQPFADTVPVFVGDLLRYIDGRGRPGAPGPIMDRVLSGLAAARDAALAPDEPLVVLTHSMGGQLLYDAVTSFAGDCPGGMPAIDVWCAAGGQVGLFRRLGVFLDAGRPDGGAGEFEGGVGEREGGAEREGEHRAATLCDAGVGYFWNAWSSTDLLSYPAAGWVADAHDTDLAYPGTVATTHNAYLSDRAFYRILAAQVVAHGSSRRH